VNQDHGVRFIRTVFGLSRRTATGVLEVSCDDRRARLSFSRGRLVFAEHKSLGSTLGAYLVTRGYLTRAQYQRVAEHVRQVSDKSAMLVFVENAVTMGLLEVEQANSIVAGQVERNFVELFAWERFDFSFLADDESVEKGPRFACDLEALVMQGIRARFDTEAIKPLLESRMTFYPKTVASAADLVRTFRLQPAELRVARALNGEKTTAQIFEVPGLDPKAAAHVLLVLKLAQQVEWATGPGEEGTLADSSPTNSVPLAAIRLQSQQRLTPPSVRLTLPQPPSAAEIDAASAFRRGVAHYKQGDLGGARAELAKAVAIVDHPEYQLYAAWVDHELEGSPRDPTSFAKLAEAARRALERDPTLAFGYFVVAHLHLMQNDALNAELAFRRAAKLDPTDVRANEEAERLRVARHGRPNPS
jgi:tetratricopeptide (TPR) repeat protein